MNLKELKNSSKSPLRRTSDAKTKLVVFTDVIPSIDEYEIDEDEFWDLTEEHLADYDVLDEDEDMIKIKANEDCFLYLGPKFYEPMIFNKEVEGLPTPAKLKKGKKYIIDDFSVAER